mmetsp:Transcript_33339/g.74613  ORF Transcript_33339/g.74613 Transcript_33339/m.74613 type:complete len:238 (-) Transcript_33339:1136-1849(-)
MVQAQASGEMATGWERNTGPYRICTGVDTRNWKERARATATLGLSLSTNLDNRPPCQGRFPSGPSKPPPVRRAPRWTGVSPDVAIATCQHHIARHTILLPELLLLGIVPGCRGHHIVRCRARGKKVLLHQFVASWRGHHIGRSRASGRQVFVCCAVTRRSWHVTAWAVLLVTPHGPLQRAGSTGGRRSLCAGNTGGREHLCANAADAGVTFHTTAGWRDKAPQTVSIGGRQSGPSCC